MGQNQRLENLLTEVLTRTATAAPATAAQGSLSIDFETRARLKAHRISVYKVEPDLEVMIRFIKAVELSQPRLSCPVTRPSGLAFLYIQRWWRPGYPGHGLAHDVYPIKWRTRVENLFLSTQPPVYLPVVIDLSLSLSISSPPART